MVKWKKADVFNPAAIVKNDTIFVLSRCEDNPAADTGWTHFPHRYFRQPGRHPFHFFPEPVLYPAKDDFQKYDYPGGCEDPRIVQTEEGLYIWPILPGIIRFPDYPSHFQKIFFTGKKRDRPLPKHITTVFWIQPASQHP